MKKYCIAAVIVLLGVLIWFYLHHPLITRVQVGNSVFTVELAVTEVEKEKGLGYRDSLAKGHGMLFPYDHADLYSFWMKGMRFPIDIIWIRDGKVVDISENIPVATTEPLPTYSPKTLVNQVLEVKAGSVNQDGIKIGDSAIILKE